jgi:hypothetical protein
MMRASAISIFIPSGIFALAAAKLFYFSHLCNLCNLWFYRLFFGACN